jgi:hypothetical protein
MHRFAPFIAITVIALLAGCHKREDRVGSVDHATTQPGATGEVGLPGGVGLVCGGVITFGGGVPLYRDQTRVGGLGLSGDTPCADHEIAKRIRDAAHLNPAKGATADDITYSSADGASVYTHPLCPNTWRNGVKIGEAPPAQGY